MRLDAGLSKGHLIDAAMNSYQSAKDKGSTTGMLKAIDLMVRLSGLYSKN